MADLKDELAEMLLENLGQSDEDIDRMEMEKFQRSLKYKTPPLDGGEQSEEEEKPTDKSKSKMKSQVVQKGAYLISDSGKVQYLQTDGSMSFRTGPSAVKFGSKSEAEAFKNNHPARDRLYVVMRRDVNTEAKTKKK